MKKIAIFASGAGSNAKEIIRYFDQKKPEDTIQVALVVTNNSQAGVIQVAETYKIPTLIIEKVKFLQGNGYADQLKEAGINFIVLAGFLWKVPDTLIEAFPNKIINIHPALLPKYGGKGMYGRFVHQAIIENREKESGITIHFVDGHYDNGDIIFQATCPVQENDTAESLARRVQMLEHEHYPKVVEKVVKGERV